VQQFRLLHRLVTRPVIEPYLACGSAFSAEQAMRKTLSLTTAHPRIARPGQGRVTAASRAAAIQYDDHLA
jgi:hypothetical protein